MTPNAHHHHPGGDDHPVELGHPGHATATGHAAQDKHAGHSVAMFRRKFWISLGLTLPTLIWGHMLPRALDYTPPPIPGQRWIAPLFGTAVFLLVCVVGSLLLA